MAVLFLWAGAARAGTLALAVGGPTLAATQLAIEGIDLGVNGVNTAGGVVLNRPWTFMFADGTPALQDFASDVAAPGGLAAATAASAGFLGWANSSGSANGATGALATAVTTAGLASGNSTAGIGSTYISAMPISRALVMHITTMVVDPLSAPNTPIAPGAPPDPDTLTLDSDFVPSSASIDAYVTNEFGERYDLFQFGASLGYDVGTGSWDSLEITESGPGGVASSWISESLFSPYVSPEGGTGWELTGVSLSIPYELPTNFLSSESTVVLEAYSHAASVPEPSTLVLLMGGLVGLARVGGKRVR
ncbi:PEP-CTERM sorting domain-containing protein [Myxococcota bacterium]|nr:PEP-CTERM sorting domain-containing protein [Myxococcota bacterium]